MIHILFIVPYPELREKVEYVLDNHPENKRICADIQVLTVDQISKINAGSYDAVIARGFSAKQLKTMHPQTPVIDLAISGYDIIRTVAECRKDFNSTRIAICGFYGKIYEASDIYKLLGCQVEIYPASNHKDLEANIGEAIVHGCDALIGGYSAVELAERHGILSRLIRTGEDTILQAINEAIRTVEQIQIERIVAETYKTIIYASKDGILYIDSSGTIRVRNRVVKAMNNNISLLSKSLQTTLPYLYKSFSEVLKGGQEINGSILTIPKSNITVSASFVPVVVNNNISGVVITLSDITQIQKLENQIRRSLSEKGLRAKYTFDDIIHKSAVIDATIDTACRYAASDSNVIIVGETGTGKELFAQSIHNASSRKNGPFVAINCAALPENLLESELFGYVEGAFTGSVKGGKMGLFEQAHGGTLFLDEIGEISLSTQTKLLRVLQEREVRRIGDNKVISINVRIISATNKSINQLAGKELFRRDLMYRLDVLRIFLPPLRQRERDAELLFLHLMRQRGQENGIPVPEINISALSVLNDYPFSGNIRELRNIVERSLVICSGNAITRDDLLKALYPQDLEDTSPLPSYTASQTSSEESSILWALRECSGNQTKAARLLGINRSTLWRKMQKYNIKI